MTYNETINFLFDQLPMYQRVGAAAYRKDLNNTIQLSQLFNNPQDKFKSIHVAGTNGKGSVSHMLAAIFQQSGYKVGLHTSPHLLDYRERIKINGELISEKEVVNFVERYHSISIGDLRPSFFEFSVVMAFDYFAREKVDIAIIEVGMGGRLDSTNIVTPELSVITNISKDHTAFLGNDILTIAKEKAGIIKPNVPVVIGETQMECETVFKAQAQHKNSPIFFADQKMELLDSGKALYVHNDGINFGPIVLDLKGAYQKKNVITVLQAVEVLKTRGYKLENECTLYALKNVATLTGLQGRWQMVKEKPFIVCDTGHNKAGVAQLVKQIEKLPTKRKHIVWGMVEDKEIKEILEMLPEDASYYFTKARIPRSKEPAEIQKLADQIGLHSSIYDHVKDAFEQALQNACYNDLIFIGGSTFVVADFLSDCKRNFD